MKYLSVLVGAALMAACQDQTMTGVERSAATAGPRYSIENSNADNARVAIDDVVGRIIPALSDAKSATGLVAAFQGLQQTVDAGNAADAPGLARAAQVEVDRYARSSSADQAELDAMRLALAAVIGQ